jgi:hypothetical protein
MSLQRFELDVLYNWVRMSAPEYVVDNVLCPVVHTEECGRQRTIGSCCYAQVYWLPSSAIGPLDL